MAENTGVAVYVAEIAENVEAENQNVKFDFISLIITAFLPMLLEMLKNCGGGTSADAKRQLAARSDGNGGYNWMLMVQGGLLIRRAGRQAARDAQKTGGREARRAVLEVVGNDHCCESMLMHTLHEIEDMPDADLATCMSSLQK